MLCLAHHVAAAGISARHRQATHPVWLKNAMHEEAVRKQEVEWGELGVRRGGW